MEIVFYHLAKEASSISAFCIVRFKNKIKLFLVG